MTEPLGQSQVLSYLLKMSNEELEFHIISFEKEEDFFKNKEVVLNLIKNHNIKWHPLSYTKKPAVLSTLYDIKRATKLAKRLNSQSPFTIVHCRGYILNSIAVQFKEKYSAKYIFDMRGWWPDEKKESGLWNSIIYKPVYLYYKKLEKKYFKQADIIVSLTHAGKNKIIELGHSSSDKVKIIPTCVNFDVFKPFNQKIREQKRKELKIDKNATVFLYSGSVGANYRTDLVIKFYKQLQKIQENTCLLFLSHSDHSIIYKELQKANLTTDTIRITSCLYNEVGDYLMVGDVGMIMYNTGFSVIGRSPTKLGEYWASGLKCLSCEGIGDLTNLLKSYPKGGALVKGINASEDEYKRSVKKVLKENVTKEELREYAINYFDLSTGVQRYKEIYDEILN
ncbi:MAG: glycosyltransferase [Chitinophagales bacterium]